MKFKKEYLILLLIIVALSLYLGMRSRNQTHYELPQVAQVDSQKINRMVITKNNQPIELNKKDDQWYVGPKAYAADDVKVKNMVKAAADLNLSDLISESGNYERYDLTDDQKINVQAFEGSDKVRDFDVGKTAPTFEHTFTRLAGDSKVYNAMGQLSTTFNHKADDLRDMNVLTFEKNDITTLMIQKGEQTLTLAKKEVVPEETAPPTEEDKTAEAGEVDKAEDKTPAQSKDKEPAESKPKLQWLDEQGKAVDQSAVERLLGDFSKFNGSQYLADEEAESLKSKSPVMGLTFKSDKQTYTLSVYDKPGTDATDYPALSSKQPYAFTIAKNKQEAIQKQVDKLLGATTKTE